MHKQPLRTAKEHVQLLAALDSFLPNGKKDSDLTPFIIPVYGPAVTRSCCGAAEANQPWAKTMEPPMTLLKMESKKFNTHEIS